jgi:riboflavin biosynthesis pyrimidine reductase
VRQIYPAAVPARDNLREAPELLAGLYAYPDAAGPGRPWVRANMISSADGAATADGRSGGLAGPGDRALFRVLRGLADVILVGGGTARAEHYRPAQAGEVPAALRAGRAPTPPIAVVSGSLDLDPEAPLLADAPDDARTIILTTQAAPAGRRAALARHADVVVAGTDRVTPDQAITALADRGHCRILTEGGPSLLAQIAGAGRLDELCLTISPFLAGGLAGRVLASVELLPGSPQPLSVAHVLADEGYLFCRYLTRATDPAGIA